MIRLPKRKRGGQSKAAQALYQEQLLEFFGAILRIKSTLDFGIGVREWGYLLEEHGLVKGEFGALGDLITQCRKDTLAPQHLPR